MLNVWKGKGPAITPSDVVLEFEEPDYEDDDEDLADQPSANDFALVARMCARR